MSRIIAHIAHIARLLPAISMLLSIFLSPATIARLLFAQERAATRRASLSRTAWRLVASDRAGRTGSAK